MEMCTAARKKKEVPKAQHILIKYNNKHNMLVFYKIWKKYKLVKGKVFYGQEPRSGESTTTECGFNYQLLAVIY